MRVPDDKGRIPLTAAEIGAVLGVTSSAIRQAVRRHDLHHVGKEGRAKLYWTHEVGAAIGGHDRQALVKSSGPMSH